MPRNDDKRRDALAGASLPFAQDDTPREPAEALGLAGKGTTPTPAALTRRPSERGTPIRPSEKRRKRRMLTVTFSDPDTLERVRGLAEQWGLYAPDGTPSPSAVVEYLLLPQLEAAERGEIGGP